VVGASDDGQRIGSARVSTFDQNVSRQLERLTLNRIFIAKASTKDAQRLRFWLLQFFVAAIIFSPFEWQKLLTHIITS
jgi:hypothetical protein